MNTIEFPIIGLKLEDVSGVAIPLPFLGGGIRYYALIIITGILLGYAYIYREARRLGEDNENVSDILLFALPISIIFARAYYCLFSWESFRDNPLSVFYIWEGGLAIYGAVIGALLTCLIFCKVKKLSTFLYLDLAGMGMFIGQSIGRWGNFINAEAYGTPTELPWRMIVNGTSAHPTFLYESLWNVLGFLLVHFFKKRKPFQGAVFCFYLVWYGVGRFFIERLRTDSLMLGNMRISMAISALAIIIGIVIYLYLLGRKNQVTLDEA